MAPTGRFTIRKERQGCQQRTARFGPTPGTRTTWSRPISTTSCPEHLRDRMPKTVRDEDRGIETITVDGQSFERSIPKPMTPEQLLRNRRDALRGRPR